MNSTYNIAGSEGFISNQTFPPGHHSHLDKVLLGFLVFLALLAGIVVIGFILWCGGCLASRGQKKKSRESQAFHLGLLHASLNNPLKRLGLLADDFPKEVTPPADASTMPAINPQIFERRNAIPTLDLLPGTRKQVIVRKPVARPTSHHADILWFDLEDGVMHNVPLDD